MNKKFLLTLTFTAFTYDIAADIFLTGQSASSPSVYDRLNNSTNNAKTNPNIKFEELLQARGFNKLIDEIDQIRILYRNDATHSTLMTCHQAEVCGNIIILVRKLILSIIKL